MSLRQDMPSMNNNHIEHHKIKYGTQIIPFQLEYRKRKTLEIGVYPDMSVKIKAPLKRTYREIEEKVRKRAAWIIEQRYFFSLFLPKQPERKYIGGETHYYLGRQYRLKIINSKKEDVKLKGGYIYIYTSNRKNSSKVKMLLDNWYRSHAQLKYEHRLIICYNLINKYKIDIPKLQIRKMTKRWGSCSPKGIIILNTQLIKAPSHCIDYVIIHELCHLKHPNHSKAFYRLLTQVMPNWEIRRKRLELVEI